MHEEVDSIAANIAPNVAVPSRNMKNVLVASIAVLSEKDRSNNACLNRLCHGMLNAK